MAWGPEQCAGFALTALLADDRSLEKVGDVLTSPLRAELLAFLALAGPSGSSGTKAHTIAEWLKRVRPPLDASACALPSRMRALLARTCSEPVRSALLADAAPARAGFAADEALLAVVVRIARSAARRAETTP